MESLRYDISSNLLDMDKSVSAEEYVSSVVVMLGDILSKRFPNNLAKQKVRVHRDRINFACPYCGDSMQSSYKKRGNIILNGKHRNFYKCFNCGQFVRVDKFFMDYHVELDLGIVNYIGQNLGDFSRGSSSKYDVSLLLDIDEIERYAIDRGVLKKAFGLIEARDSIVWPWLTKRLQFQHERFLYSPTKKYLLILNLTKSGKVIGSQKRLFYGTNKYLTFGSSKLHELLGNPKPPEHVDSISHLFGILELDFSRPVTVFEGAMDSFLFNNSVANSGLQKSFPIDIPVRYWFDNDKPGREKAMAMMERGESVFLWEKFLTDVGAPFRKKWDLNDLLVWAKQEKVTLPSFHGYFSSDSLDMMDI